MSLIREDLWTIRRCKKPLSIRPQAANVPTETTEASALPFPPSPVPREYDVSLPGADGYRAETNLKTRLLNAMPSEEDALSMYRWMQSNPSQIKAIMDEINQGNYPVWMSKDAFSPLELVFEKQE